MMQEYWVNVYESNGILGAFHDNKKDADLAHRMFNAYYRIHVKMKPVKPKFDDKFIQIANNYTKYDDSFARDIERMKPTEWADKLDWMG